MVMLKDQLQTNLNQALKEKDEIRVSTLRLLLSEVHNKEIELRQKLQDKSLPDEDVIGVIRKEVKRRQEAIEAYKQGKRDDLVKKEEAELGILNKYLPQQMPPEELEEIIKETIEETGAVGAKDFGKVMGAVMAKVKGRADGKTIAEVVKKLLS